MSTKKILAGKTVVLTRSEEQSATSSLLFEELGATVINFPVVEVVELMCDDFDNFFKNNNRFDYIVFASSNAVKYFFLKIQRLGINLNDLNKKFVVSGKKTAETLSFYGFSASIIPSSFSAKGILKSFSEENLDDKIILLPRSLIGRDELQIGLQKLKANVKVFNIYNVIIPSATKTEQQIQYLLNTNIDWLIFTSPSTFKNFLTINQAYLSQLNLNNKNIAVIGPTTKEVVEASGYKVTIVPQEFTLNAIAKKISEYYQQNNNLELI